MPPAGLETVTTPLVSEVVEVPVMPLHDESWYEPDIEPDVVRVMDVTVVSIVDVEPPRYAVITGSVLMIDPEYPAFGCVVKERKEDVDPDTAITCDIAVRLGLAPLVATSLKLTAEADEVVRLIVQPL